MGSFLFWLTLIGSALATAWWALRRSHQLREEAQQREAAALSALIAAPVSSPALATTSAAASPAALVEAAVPASPAPKAASLTKLAALAELMPLVLAFYQLRGYERIASETPLPYLFAVLRHRQQVQRLYALIELPKTEKLSGKRLAQLARELHQHHFDCAIVVTAAGFDFDALALAKTLHFRLYDRAAITARLQELPAPLQEKLTQIDATFSSTAASS